MKKSLLKHEHSFIGAFAALILCFTLYLTPCYSQEALGVFSPGVYNAPAQGPLSVLREVASPEQIAPADQVIQLRSEINQSRRPYIGSVFGYSSQSLVNKDYQLATVTEGTEFGFFPNEQTQIKFDYLPTQFGLQKPVLAGQEFRGTILGQPTNRLHYIASLGLFQYFHNVKSGLSVLGNVGAEYALNDRFSVNLYFSRYIIANSRLSATGLDLAGTNTVVGRVTAYQFNPGFNWRPSPKTDFNFQYATGFYAGQEIQTNPFQQFSVRAGRTLISHERTSHLQFLAPSYQLIAMGFAHDLSGFGNASLIPSPNPAVNAAQSLSSAAGYASLPMGINAPGVGGYFSPQLFYANLFRVDAGGRLFKHVFYDIGGGVGTQNFKDKDTNTPLSRTSLLGMANVSVIAKVSKHFTIEQGAYFLQAGEQYRRFVVYQQTRYYF